MPRWRCSPGKKPGIRVCGASTCGTPAWTRMRKRFAVAPTPAAPSAHPISSRIWKGFCDGVWRRKKEAVHRKRGSTQSSRPSVSASFERTAVTSRLSPVSPVAVGTIIADRPPHRSVRAELPHTAPTLDGSVKSHVGIWMQDSGSRYPPVEGRSQPVPSRPPALAAAAQNGPPKRTQTSKSNPRTRRRNSGTAPVTDNGLRSAPIRRQGQISATGVS